MLKYFLLFILFFVICQILVEKEKLPAFLMQISLGKLIFVGIGLVALSMVVGFLIHQAFLLTAGMTVFVASLISGRYRKEFDHYEPEKK